MIDIDKYAYMSKLKQTNPMLKFIFSFLTLSVCLWAGSVLISVSVVTIMTLVTVFKGGTPFSLFVKLMLVPISFLIIGVLTIAISAADNQNTLMFSLTFAGTHIGVSHTGLLEGVRLFFKALGAVACLYCLSLSTPMVDLLSVFRRLKMPKLIVELMGLIYRFIFVLLETANTMITAQNSRLGYSSLPAGFRSLGTLVSTLFIRSYKRSSELYTALEARGYDGELNVLEETFDTHWTGYIPTAAINLVLVTATLLLRRFAGGIPV